MKKIIYIPVLLAAMLFTACENEEISIELKQAAHMGQLTVNIDPTGLFSSYTYEDTHHHNIKPLSTQYRTFNSAYGNKIELRSLFYNKDNDLLVDSVVTSLTNTNTYTQSLELPLGDYTVVSTLSLIVTNGERTLPIWQLANREKLSTANMQPRTLGNEWCLLAVSTDDVKLTSDGQVRLNTAPMPVGSIVYSRFENFQYVSEETKETVADNGIRQLSIYTRNYPISYNLDPKAPNKVNFRNDGGENSWYAYNEIQPQKISPDWTFFKGNTYSYFFTLASNAKIKFGYTLEGKSTFNGYGEQTVNIEPGKTYLAYWDYFMVGSPYFGIADNNHFHSYN